MKSLIFHCLSLAVCSDLQQVLLFLKTEYSWVLILNIILILIINGSTNQSLNIENATT